MVEFKVNFALLPSIEGRKKMGQPRTAGRGTILGELKKAGIGSENAARLEQGRAAWRDLVAAFRATVVEAAEGSSESTENVLIRNNIGVPFALSS